MEQENIIQPEDLSSLRAEMYDKISHAETIGIFTSKEAVEWESGVDACEEAGHIENLIEIIDSFVDSGTEVMQKIEDLANHELVNSKEGHHFVNEAETSSYQVKIRIIGELNILIETTEKLKKSLLKILDNKDIPQTEKNWLIKEFYDATNKETVVSKAQSIQAPEKIIKPKTNTAEYSEPIIQLIRSMRLPEARQLLNTHRSIFDLKEYKRIFQLIDIQEAKKVSLAIKKAA